MTKSSEERKFLIYEAINDVRREIYVAMTAEPMAIAIRRLTESPPPELRDWDFGTVKTFRSIEYGMGEGEATEFIARYARSTLPKGWRFANPSETTSKDPQNAP